MSWGGGGNLPPLLAAGSLLAARDCRVYVLASVATRQPAAGAGFDVIGYRRSPDPDLETAFEQQVAEMMATAAGPEIALDVREVVAELRPELMIVDCMLPAGIAAGEATGTPTASLVHFPYGLPRQQLLRGASAWTTDRAQLDTTPRRLGLEPTSDDLAAWESVELLLVTVPTWFDLPAQYPAKVVHAGPLGVTQTSQAGSAPAGRALVLLSFSTTVMHGQEALIQRVCDAIAGQSLDAILTLGPAVSTEAISPPANVEMRPYADHDHLLPRCAVPASAYPSRQHPARSRPHSSTSAHARTTVKPLPMPPPRSRPTNRTRRRPRRSSVSLTSRAENDRRQLGPVAQVHPHRRRH
ncbi:MAG TPA: hypothetical protein VFA45_17285 [Actinomycetes bacterium]|nr:hypothetical protein [Actinomycetes bacterium]